MTDLQKQIEPLEGQGNEAELLSLLACDSEARCGHRLRAYKFRLQAVELRYNGSLGRQAPTVGGQPIK
jgi:hypothetical protein